jgi:hypothetical protein
MAILCLSKEELAIMNKLASVVFFALENKPYPDIDPPTEEEEKLLASIFKRIQILKESQDDILSAGR